MSELIRANIGGMDKARYFERTEQKAQTLYVDVVETRRVRNEATGAWEDGEQRWYEAKFDGADADWVRNELRNGDSVLIYGRTREKEREVDGRTYYSTKLFVDAVALNPHLSRISIDRTPRQAQDRDIAQAAAQQAMPEPAPPVAAAPAQAAARPQHDPWAEVNQRHSDVQRMEQDQQLRAAQTYAQ